MNTNIMIQISVCNFELGSNSLRKLNDLQENKVTGKSLLKFETCYQSMSKNKNYITI